MGLVNGKNSESTNFQLLYREINESLDSVTGVLDLLDFGWMNFLMIELISLKLLVDSGISDPAILDPGLRELFHLRSIKYGTLIPSNDQQNRLIYLVIGKGNFLLDASLYVSNI